MKKFFLVILTTTLSINLMAQQNKIKEAGVVFSNINNFGLAFKVGDEKSLWRFSVVSLYSNNDNIVYVNYTELHKTYGGGLKAGKEFRKVLSDNFEFRYGADLSFNYNYSLGGDDYLILINDVINETKKYIPGLNLVVELNYVLRNNIIIGAELTPGISYSFSKVGYIKNAVRTTTDNSGLNLGIFSSPIQFTVAYRF